MVAKEWTDSLEGALLSQAHGATDKSAITHSSPGPV